MIFTDSLVSSWVAATVDSTLIALFVDKLLALWMSSTSIGLTSLGLTAIISAGVDPVPAESKGWPLWRSLVAEPGQTDSLGSDQDVVGFNSRRDSAALWDPQFWLTWFKDLFTFGYLTLKCPEHYPPPPKKKKTRLKKSFSPNRALGPWSLGVDVRD